jgi:leucyl-tRNA synthetase
MEFHNEVKGEPISLASIKTFLILLYPFAPHVSEELNQLLSSVTITRGRAQSQQSLQLEKWPVFDPAKVIDQTVEVVVQVNGKVRDTIRADSSELKIQSNIENKAKRSEKVKKYLDGNPIQKVIYIEGKILNFVIN